MPISRHRERKKVMKMDKKHLAVQGDKFPAAITAEARPYWGRPYCDRTGDGGTTVLRPYWGPYWGRFFVL